MKFYLIICIFQTYNNLQDEIISAQKVLLHGITSRIVHQLIRCGISGGFFSRAYLDTFALRRIPACFPLGAVARLRFRADLFPLSAILET